MNVPPWRWRKSILNESSFLNDALARRVAQEMGLEVWGTLRVMLEAKKVGRTNQIAPLVSQLVASGMWLSDDIRLRILRMAGES